MLVVDLNRRPHNEHQYHAIHMLFTRLMRGTQTSSASDSQRGVAGPVLNPEDPETSSEPGAG